MGVAREGTARRKSELSTREKEVTKLPSELQVHQGNRYPPGEDGTHESWAAPLLQGAGEVAPERVTWAH